MGWAGSLCPERVLKDFNETARPRTGERAVFLLYSQFFRRNRLEWISILQKLAV
jgi:hypothetical protein